VDDGAEDGLAFAQKRHGRGAGSEVPLVADGGVYEFAPLTVR